MHVKFCGGGTDKSQIQKLAYFVCTAYNKEQADFHGAGTGIRNLKFIRQEGGFLYE